MQDLDAIILGRAFTPPARALAQVASPTPTQAGTATTTYPPKDVINFYLQNTGLLGVSTGTQRADGTQEVDGFTRSRAELWIGVETRRPSFGAKQLETLNIMKGGRSRWPPIKTPATLFCPSLQ